jgi:hypothetical protein
MDYSSTSSGQSLVPAATAGKKCWTQAWNLARPEYLNVLGFKRLMNFKQEMTQYVRERNTDCTIFYNAGHIGPRHRQVKHAYSHFELESLPGGEWGYLHFPATIRYARTLGLECVGMTGKFHTSWGDFHSFKNLQALRYECLRMLTHGAKCMIGDQLHPDGRIDSFVTNLFNEKGAPGRAKSAV